MGLKTLSVHRFVDPYPFMLIDEDDPEQPIARFADSGTAALVAGVLRGERNISEVLALNRRYAREHDRLSRLVRLLLDELKVIQPKDGDPQLLSCLWCRPGAFGAGHEEGCILPDVLGAVRDRRDPERNQRLPLETDRNP